MRVGGIKFLEQFLERLDGFGVLILSIQAGKDGFNFLLGDDFLAVTLPDAPQLRTGMILPLEVIPDPPLDHVPKNLKGKNHQ